LHQHGAGDVVLGAYIGQVLEAEVPRDCAHRVRVDPRLRGAGEVPYVRVGVDHLGAWCRGGLRERIGRALLGGARRGGHGRGGSLGGHCGRTRRASIPPSTARVTPAVEALRGPARYATASATSTASTRRPCG